MDPKLRADAEKRAAELEMSFSDYVRRCLIIDIYQGGKMGFRPGALPATIGGVVWWWFQAATNPGGGGHRFPPPRPDSLFVNKFSTALILDRVPFWEPDGNQKPHIRAER